MLGLKLRTAKHLRENCNWHSTMDFLESNFIQEIGKREASHSRQSIHAWRTRLNPHHRAQRWLRPMMQMRRLKQFPWMTWRSRTVQWKLWQKGRERVFKKERRQLAERIMCFGAHWIQRWGNLRRCCQRVAKVFFWSCLLVQLRCRWWQFS